MQQPLTATYRLIGVLLRGEVLEQIVQALLPRTGSLDRPLCHPGRDDGNDVGVMGNIHLANTSLYLLTKFACNCHRW